MMIGMGGKREFKSLSKKSSSDNIRMILGLFDLGPYQKHFFFAGKKNIYYLGSMNPQTICERGLQFSSDKKPSKTPP